MKSFSSPSAATARSRFYHLRDDTSPNDLHAEQVQANGVLGAMFESPLHSSEGMQHPVRVHPDGLIVMLGSGRIHDADDLQLLGELGTAFEDAAWQAGQLVTLQAIAPDSELWSP